MELKQCKNGHLYDPSITPECPECAAQGLPQEDSEHYGKTMPLGGGSFDQPVAAMPDSRSTEPLESSAPLFDSYSAWDDKRAFAYAPSEPIGKTQPLIKNTQPLEPGYGPAGMGYPGKPSADPYGGTQPLHRPTVDMNPHVPLVTGWLVCVDGPGKGRDYRLHEDYNYIGRSPEMDVSILDDMYISREKHAIIAYDNQERKFYFAPYGGASMVRQNGKVVLNSVELAAGDRLQIGRSTFCFVPFCGEAFQW